MKHTLITIAAALVCTLNLTGCGNSADKTEAAAASASAIDKNDPDTFAKVEAALPVDKRTAFNEAWTKLRCKLESEGADTVTAIRRSAELLDGKSGDEVISYAAQL